MSRGTTPNRRRAFIGNLRNRSNLAQDLYRNLFATHCLSVKNYPDGDGIVIVYPKRTNSHNLGVAHALVEFSDVDYAIQVLNGVRFDGRVLNVSQERIRGGGDGVSRTRGAFGSSRWAAADGKDEDRQGLGFSNKHKANTTETKIEKNPEYEELVEDDIVKEVESIIATEILESSDQITTTIACAASMTLISSLHLFGSTEDSVLDSKNDVVEVARTTNSSRTIESFMSQEDFRNRCMLPLSELLNEYGEQDSEWKKKEITNSINEIKNRTNEDFESRHSSPTSKLFDGEQDDELTQQHSLKLGYNGAHDGINMDHSGIHMKTSKLNTEKRDDASSGMLAPFGKAFIHLELESFGYKYGAPSHVKNGFTYAHPLPPIDIRDLDCLPANLAKFNGLSYLVKRSLLKSCGDNDKRESTEGSHKLEEAHNVQPLNAMRNRANKIADDVIKVLVEAINEGGYGPISPLTMTISIGSEYGRHRSVVLVEHLALIMQARLRRNDGKSFKAYENVNDSDIVDNGIVRQFVSVKTRHRDIEANHRDDKAFDGGLKCQSHLERARRQKLPYDDDHW